MVFTATQEIFGETHCIRLTDVSTGAMVEILPFFGATLNALVLSKQGKTYELIEGSKSYEDFLAEGLSAYKGPILFPTPNRVKNGTYFFQGKQYQLPLNETARNNSLHGLICQSRFEIDTLIATDTEASCTLVHVYNRAHAGYPFKVFIQVVYTLNSSGFTCSTRIRNIDGQDIPAGLGWHPYFKLGKEINVLQLKLPKGKGLEVDEQMIPNGKYVVNTFETEQAIGDHFLDTGFQLETEGLSIVSTTVKDSFEQVGFEVWQTVGKSGFNYLQVYTPASRDRIAIEPMTCAADAFNQDLGAWLLKQGETRVAEYGVKML